MAAHSIQRLVLGIALGSLSAAAIAAKAARFTTIETEASGTPVVITEMYAHKNGDLLVLTYGVDIGASSAGSAGSPVKVTTSRGALRDKMLFRAATEEVIFSDRGQCQRIGADSEARAGHPTGGMDQYQQQMQAAQAEMDKAFAEMAKQNPQLAEQMRNSVMGGNNPMMRPRNELELVETDNKRNIDGRETEEFQIRNVRTGEVKHTVWAARASEVEGGELIGRNSQHMYSVVQSNLDNMGVGALGGTSIMGAISEKMSTHVPILTINHDDNSQTRLQSADADASAEFEIDCTN